MLDDTPLMTLLQTHIAPHVRWHNQRLRFLAAFLPALIGLATVNLAKLALALSAKPSSNYRRIQRFFAEATLPQQAVAAFVLHLLPTDERFVIALDRTEWHFGRTPINIFMASLVHDGTAFPLVWVMLGKAGSTSGAEQRALVRKLLLVMPPERVGVVLADREFIGKPFMGYLTARGVGYGVRIRKDARVGHRGRTQRVEALFADLAVGEHRRLRARRTVYGQAVWLYALRLPDGKGSERRLLIVAGTVRRLLRLYRLRWGIEVLFAGLKTRGFDFETTHLSVQGRISTLVGVLALAYSLAHATGRYLSAHAPIVLKRHGRRARSVFRLGLDHLRHVLLRRERRAWRALLRLFMHGSVGPAPAPI
ncbi:MAG: IS4 family transposase, partial [Rhodothermales bacterium]